MLRFPTSGRKLRGGALLDVMLSLAVVSALLVGGTQAFQRYTQSVKVQAAATLLTKIKNSASMYGDDHFEQLLAAAPQRLPIDVLRPYLGDATLLTDPFRAPYAIQTRTYTFDTPDPVTGGVLTQTALQLLVFTERTIPEEATEIDAKPGVRIDIANTAGPDAGYFAVAGNGYLFSCEAPNGNQRPAGSICGAYGSYGYGPNVFGNVRDTGLYGAVVTKGDSSVYGDQLYRYDYGDPELNTMHTALNMDSNSITNARHIQGTEWLEMAGNRAVIGNPNGEISVHAQGSITIAPSNGRINLDGPNATLTVANNSLAIVGPEGELNPIVASIGNSRTEYLTANGRTTQATTADGRLHTGAVISSEIKADEINSLHKRPEDPLRLQKFRRGEVVVGNRVQYQPPSGLSASVPSYALSDGQITTGVLKTQDITCADCGGNLSQVLPKWRQMGTYFVPDTQNQSVYIRKPQCTDNTRRDEINRPAFGNEAQVSNSENDERYTPRIILVPKHIAREDDAVEAKGGFDVELRARDVVHENTPHWEIFVHKEGAHDFVRVEALAMTYCVFLGGDSFTVYPHTPGMTATRSSQHGGAWDYLD